MPDPSHQPDPDNVLTIALSRDDRASRLTLAGELDLHGADRLATHIADLAAEAPARALQLDLGGLTFIDSTGLQVLLQARSRANDDTRDFRIVAASRTVERLVRLAGLDDLLELPA